MQVGKLTLIGLALAVSGCSDSTLNMTTPSQLNVEKIQVKEQMLTETLPATRVDKDQVASLAKRILRNGNPEVILTVPYLPGGQSAAQHIGEIYQVELGDNGVKNVAVGTTMVVEAAEADKAVIAYTGLVAAKPADCGRLPGYQGTETMDAYRDYKFGCETQTALSKMADDPADLLGTSRPAQADSRRNGAIIERYQAGTPNEPLQGMQASTVGQ